MQLWEELGVQQAPCMYVNSFQLRNKIIGFLFWLPNITWIPLFSVLNAATSLMIKKLRTISGLDYLEIIWKHPRYLPENYAFAYSCRLKRGRDDYVTKPSYDLSPKKAFIRVSGLQPDSICKLTLIAVYNPASYDNGITITAATLSEGQGEFKPYIGFT